MHRTHPQDAHILLSLPDTADQDIQKLNQPPSPQVLQLIQEFRYVAALTEINHNESNLLYQQISFDENLLSQLKVFGHPKLDDLPPLESVAVQYVNLRAEGRFLYKTRVMLKINKEQFIDAHTRDFSSRGLQIETHEPVAYQKGDKIQLSLPDMQRSPVNMACKSSTMKSWQLVKIS